MTQLLLAALAFSVGCIPGKDYVFVDKLDGGVSDADTKRDAVAEPEGGRDGSRDGADAQVEVLPIPANGPIAEGAIGEGIGVLAEADGSLHVAFRLTSSSDLNLNSDIGYAHWDGSEWTLEGVGGRTIGGNYFSFGIVRVGDTLHILSCEDAGRPNHHIRSDGRWTNTTLDVPSFGCDGRVFAKTDAAGVLHFLFRLQGEIYHVRYEGGLRYIKTVPVANEPDSLGVAMTPDGKLAISYFESMNVDRPLAVPHLLIWDGDAWQEQTPSLSAEPGCLAGRDGLGFDPLGRSFVLCNASGQKGLYALRQHEVGGPWRWEEVSARSDTYCADVATTSTTHYVVFQSRQTFYRAQSAIDVYDDWSAAMFDPYYFNSACAAMAVDAHDRVHMLTPGKLEYWQR